MSLKSRSARNLAIGSLAAVASLGALAAPSMAATKTLALSCELPFIGQQPTTMSITTNLPTTAKVGKPLPLGNISTTTKFKGDTPVLFEIINAASVEGQSDLGIQLAAPGFTLPITAPTTIGTTAVSYTNPTPLVGSGGLPYLAFPTKGTATLSAASVSLTLLARDPDGLPIVGLNGSSETFDVPCSINAGQNTTLGTIKITK